MTFYPQGVEPGKPRLTERQVLQIASEFCTRLVQKTGASPEKYRLSAKKPEFEASNTFTPAKVALSAVFGPNWIVNLPNGEELRIQDSSGLVVWMRGEDRKYYSGTYLTPAKQKFLIDRVNKYKSVFWTGKDVFSTEHSIQGVRNTDNFGTKNITFSYIWERRFQGVPYINQDLNITVTTAGDLMGASLRGWTPEPKNRKPNISEQQAREIARKAATASYDLPDAPMTCSRKVVPKNRFWENKNEVDRASGNAFLAWVVEIPLEMQGRRQKRWATVGVDAESGEVIFGEVIGLR